MCVMDHYDMTLAVYLALNPSTTKLCTDQLDIMDHRVA